MRFVPFFGSVHIYLVARYYGFTADLVRQLYSQAAVLPFEPEVVEDVFYLRFRIGDQLVVIDDVQIDEEESP